MLPTSHRLGSDPSPNPVCMRNTSCTELLFYLQWGLKTDSIREGPIQYNCLIMTQLFMSFSIVEKAEAVKYL